MKYLAAYALLKLGGNADPSASEVEGFLKENGVKPDKEKIDDLIEKLGGKDFGQLVASGIEQMSVMGAPSVLPAAAAGAGDNGEAAVVLVEEKEDVDMTGLFGGESEDEYY